MRMKGVTETGSEGTVYEPEERNKQLTHRILNSGQQWVRDRGGRCFGWVSRDLGITPSLEGNNKQSSRSGPEKILESGE